MGSLSFLACVVFIALTSLTNAGLVKKILRYKRQTVDAPKEHNVTVSSLDHPVVFNHVYNINVPASSLCSVDLGSPENSQTYPKDAAAASIVGQPITEHTLDRENQIVFTHRINIPRAACGCASDLPGLKELLNRLEMLEGEVSALRDQCKGDGGCCSAAATGKVLTKPYCSNHGHFSTETCACKCDPGWKGPNCTEPECSENCHQNGRCVNGKCECMKGFGGTDCSVELCPVDCGPVGSCVGGFCICKEGFFGERCSESSCPNNCLGRGRCKDGDCVCDDPWTGSDCSVLTCPKDCYDRGRCVNGTCHCEKGFTGDDCGEHSCPNNCQGNGFCVDGQCVCTAGYRGEDCSEISCLYDCNGRGTCFNGMCICDLGYQGEDCSQVACPNNCNSRGQCINGRCSCDFGFQGDDCLELSCPNNCLHRGRCVNGQCVCEEGFAGEDCSIQSCPSNCYGRGECIKGLCVCHTGFTGDDCAELSCPNNCRNRGRCIDGQCVCHEGFSGDDCGQKACPNDCLARGRCHEGECVCEEGYSGDDCSVLSCPDNCNSRGRCVDGRCACDDGYEGESCAYLSCINNCLDKGRCVNGQCLCDEGYIGEDCSEVSPPKDLTVGEVTTDTVDLSWDNQMLVTEYLITYVPTFPGGLELELTVPGDKTTATVKELEPGFEYLIKVYAVLSNKRSIPVSARVATHLPQPEGLRFKSVRETSVEVMWDQLDISFDGWEIFFRNTKEENGKIFSTLPSSQNQFVQSGLGPGQEYEVSINIIKNDTRGPQTSKKITTKIDGPQQVEVKDVTESSALISWSWSVAPMDRVVMTYAPISDPFDEISVDIITPDKQYSIGGLRPDTDYTVSLISRSGNIISDPVSTTFTTDIDAPADLQVVSQTDTSIALQWTNSQAEVGSYRVKYSPLSGALHGEEVFPRGPGDNTQATITGLEPGTEYGIGVTAVKNERESLPATTNGATDLDPPRDFEQTESTETSLKVRWQKPKAKLGGYRLTYYFGDGQVEEVELSASATNHVLADLIPGMDYTLTLTAERGNKRSRPAFLSASTAPQLNSPAVLALTLKDTPTDPNPDVLQSLNPDASNSALNLWVSSERPEAELHISDPEQEHLKSEFEPLKDDLKRLDTEILTNLVLSAAPTEVHVAWSAPDEVFDSFEVTLSPPSAATPPHVSSTPGSRRAVKIEGLSPSTGYRVTVQGLVEGKHSLPLTGFVTTEEARRVTVVNLTISDVTWDGFTASWSPSAGDFDSFVIEVTNLEDFTESQNLTLSGDALSLGISGLNPNTGYLVGLYGMYQGSFLEPVYTEATTVNQPVVGTLFISNVTSESFSILWNGTDGEFDGFILEIIDSDWLMEPKEFNFSHHVNSYDVTGLRPSTDYVAYLYGTYRGSRTSAVSTVARTAEEPELSKLVVSQITSDRFSLSWQTREKAFDQFVVEVRESAAPSQAMGRTLPGDVLSTVMTGLRASTAYNVKLYARSVDGHHTRPLLAVATTGIPLHVLTNAPCNHHTLKGSVFSHSEEVPQLGPVAASSPSPHDLSLSWSTVSGHFDGFVIRVSDPEHQSDTLEFRLDGEARNFTLSKLMDDTGYDVELYGISHGRHTPSVLTHTVTAPLPKVENLTISNVTPYGFRVSWEVEKQQPQQVVSAPSSGGFMTFHIVVTDSGWLLEPQEFSVPGNQSHLDVSGLITGIGYEVRLTGVSDSGLLSRPLSTVAVTESEPEVEHLFVSDVTTNSFRLSWAVNDDDLFDRFVIKVRDSKRLQLPQEISVHGNERTTVITGLMGGTEYEIELYGVSLEQRSQPVTAVVQTGLSHLRGLHFSEVTDSSAVVHWSMPRSPVDTYRVTYVPFEGGSSMTLTVDGSVLEALLPNMNPGKTYRVTVSAVKGLEESEPSTETVTTALDRPRDLTAVNVTDTSACLLWQPSVAIVDGYIITYSADSVPPVVEHVSGNTVEFEMHSLVPATLYMVGVHAIKDAQKSENAVTEFSTDVDPPRDLSVVNIQTDSATLTWKPPQAAVTGYTLTFSSADGNIREVVLSPTASSYSMTQLTGSTDYNVRLRTNVGAQRSRHIAIDFSTIGQLFRRARDCAQILLNGDTTSGLYTVYVGGDDGQPVQVYCDMTTDGGGWLVFLRRQNGRLEFFRNWKNYTAGFGNLNDEFWLGLSNLHKITSAAHYELRVDLRDSGEAAYAQYDKFTIAEPRTRYKLYIGAYSGTAGDSMTYHQGRPFSTYDNDNDIAVTNCALSYKGAFWYKNCHRVNLMGKYGDTSHSKGINWFHWKGHEHSIQFAEMKIRPADFRNFESQNKHS
ncbi:tenascin isoform X2 [Gouania willdenowi]|uniref:tenascin isoform X2 n=1 Tax=Gouania willdenowi TaxID=441366 RepID=UPI0010549601|nr:tenascin-like isoform X2 [Gouania willdenowi]